MWNGSALAQQAQQRYLQMQVETASPGQLVLMLYQGCLRFIAQGRAALAAQDFDTARVSLLKAQDIIVELAASLDMEAGGEIAINLLRLYDYLHHRLVAANIHRDGDAAAEVEALLRTLLPAWEEAVRQHQADLRAAPPHPSQLAPATPA